MSVVAFPSSSLQKLPQKQPQKQNARPWRTGPKHNVKRQPHWRKSKTNRSGRNWLGRGVSIPVRYTREARQRPDVSHPLSQYDKAAAEFSVKYVGESDNGFGVLSRRQRVTARGPEGPGHLLTPDSQKVSINVPMLAAAQAEANHNQEHGHVASRSPSRSPTGGPPVVFAADGVSVQLAARNAAHAKRAVQNTAGTGAGPSAAALSHRGPASASASSPSPSRGRTATPRSARRPVDDSVPLNRVSMRLDQQAAGAVTTTAEHSPSGAAATAAAAASSRGAAAGVGAAADGRGGTVGTSQYGSGGGTAPDYGTALGNVNGRSSSNIGPLSVLSPAVRTPRGAAFLAYHRAAAAAVAGPSFSPAAAAAAAAAAAPSAVVRGGGAAAATALLAQQQRQRPPTPGGVDDASDTSWLPGIGLAGRQLPTTNFRARATAAATGAGEFPLRSPPFGVGDPALSVASIGSGGSGGGYGAYGAEGDGEGRVAYHHQPWDQGGSGGAGDGGGQGEGNFAILAADGATSMPYAVHSRIFGWKLTSPAVTATTGAAGAGAGSVSSTAPSPSLARRPATAGAPSARRSLAAQQQRQATEAGPAQPSGGGQAQQQQPQATPARRPSSSLPRTTAPPSASDTPRSLLSLRSGRGRAPPSPFANMTSTAPATRAGGTAQQQQQQRRRRPSTPFSLLPPRARVQARAEAASRRAVELRSRAWSASLHRKPARFALGHASEVAKARCAARGIDVGPLAHHAEYVPPVHGALPVQSRAPFASPVPPPGTTGAAAAAAADSSMEMSEGSFMSGVGVSGGVSAPWSTESIDNGSAVGTNATPSAAPHSRAASASARRGRRSRRRPRTSAAGGRRYGNGGAAATGGGGGGLGRLLGGTAPLSQRQWHGSVGGIEEGGSVVEGEGVTFDHLRGGAGPSAIARKRPTTATSTGLGRWQGRLTPAQPKREAVGGELWFQPPRLLGPGAEHARRQRRQPDGHNNNNGGAGGSPQSRQRHGQRAAERGADNRSPSPLLTPDAPNGGEERGDDVQVPGGEAQAVATEAEMYLQYLAEKRRAGML